MAGCASAGIAVDVGLGAEEAARDHAGHIRRMRDRRPHVILKLAVSADDKVALAGRRPAAITGEAARERVHRLRAMSDAILTGIGTVLADDPLLTCRLPGMAGESPVRVVLDAKLAAAAREPAGAERRPDARVGVRRARCARAPGGCAAAGGGRRGAGRRDRGPARPAGDPERRWPRAALPG